MVVAVYAVNVVANGRDNMQRIKKLKRKIYYIKQYSSLLKIKAEFVEDINNYKKESKNEK